ncbi:MAG: hypothetical protein QXM23_01840, partial [Archaeoglobaceae archaeon]
MYRSLDSGKKAGMISLMIITIITIGIASAAPLEIVIEEKVNTTVSPSEDSATGSISFEYETNVTGYVNITNTCTAGSSCEDQTLYDIWIALLLKNNTTTCNNLGEIGIPNYASVTVDATPPEKIAKEGVFNNTTANCVVHITLLKPGDKVSLFYDVNDTKMGINGSAPFIVEEKYDPPKIPARGNYTWTVYFNVSLNETWWQNTALGGLNGNNVLLNITKYLSNRTDHYGSDKWTLLKIEGTPSTNKSSATVYNGNYTSSGNPDTIVIPNIPLNITSDENKYVNITFNVTGNYTNSTASPYYFEPFGFAVFTFNLSFGNISGTYVVDVFAIGNASINVTKYGPNETSYWFGNASVTNTASGLTYVLTNVTMWATQTGSFDLIVSGQYRCNNSSSFTTGNVICEYNQTTDSDLPKVLGSGQSIVIPGINDAMEFNYNQVPIIWANATFKLIKSQTEGWFANNTTLHDYNATYGSNFIVIEKIYIIGTYLVKVTKHVLYNSTASTDTNVFDIYLVVENIGGNESPYVYVYDLIPQNFAEYNWNDRWDDIWSTNYVNKSSMLAGNGSVDNPMSEYVRGHYWRLKPIAPGADGDGSYTDWDEIQQNKTVVIFYQINGTGDFR